MKELKMSNRYNDTPRDKPHAERVEHANLVRPGARAHPKAGEWNWAQAPVWRV